MGVSSRTMLHRASFSSCMLWARRMEWRHAPPILGILFWRRMVGALPSHAKTPKCNVLSRSWSCFIGCECVSLQELSSLLSELRSEIWDNVDCATVRTRDCFSDSADDTSDPASESLSIIRYGCWGRLLWENDMREWRELTWLDGLDGFLIVNDTWDSTSDASSSCVASDAAYCMRFEDEKEECRSPEWTSEERIRLLLLCVDGAFKMGFPLSDKDMVERDTTLGGLSLGGTNVESFRKLSRDTWCEEW